jgi:hypothetical protein
VQLEHAAFAGRWPLLQLTGRAVGAKTDLHFADLGFAESLRPQELARLLAPVARNPGRVLGLVSSR